MKDRQAEAASIRRNMLFNTIGSLTYQGCLWITTVLVVILSDGYSASGILSFAMTVGNMFTAVGTYNMRTYQISDTKNEYSQSNYVGFRIVTLAIGAVSMAIYSLFVAPDSLTYIAVLAFLLFKIDESFCDVLYGVDQRGERMDYIGISQFVRGILLAASFSAVLYLSQNIVFAILAMYPACLLITLLFDLPHAERIDIIKPNLSAQQTRHLLKQCLPLVLETLFLGMVVSVVRQYYANAFGNDRLGIYAAVATPAVLVQAAARYLYAPTLVPLSQRWNESPQDSFLPYLKKTLRMMLIAILIFVPVLAFIGPYALELVYGSRVQGYTYLFTNVLICTAAIAIFYFLSDVLIICRDIRGSLIAAAVSLAVSLALMIPLETLFDMQGINYTIIVANLAGIAVSIICLRRNNAFRTAITPHV